MKLIAGLGNPDKKYQKNRHNLGFMVVDSFTKDEGLAWQINRDLMSYYAKKDIDYVVTKPLIFMNKSGEAVGAVCQFYKIEARDVLVVHDDLDLPFGKIRLSYNSLSAGHRGVESVIEGLSTLEFSRLRVGIGSSTGIDPEKYVLENFTAGEEGKLGDIMATCREAIRSYLKDGIEATMNRFN